MTKNEVKKELYKQKPVGYFDYIQNGVAYYYCFLNGLSESIQFKIPISDMGEAKFNEQITAHLLIRWLI